MIRYRSWNFRGRLIRDTGDEKLSLQIYIVVVSCTYTRLFTCWYSSSCARRLAMSRESNVVAAIFSLIYILFQMNNIRLYSMSAVRSKRQIAVEFV